MLLSIFVAIVAWFVSIIRSRSFKKAAVTGSVAGAITFAICLVLNIIYFAIVAA